MLPRGLTNIGLILLVALLAGPAPWSSIGLCSGSPTTSTPTPEEEMMDVKKPTRLEVPCTAEACMPHCREKSHAAGRCDGELCVCRDHKHQHSGRGNVVNNNNNNNVLVLH